MKRKIVRQYTEEFRNEAVNQVLIGRRGATEVARSVRELTTA